MIIQCPACATKYVVPDTAIGVDGRTVRCAKCKHSWFQDGPVLDLGEQKPEQKRVFEAPPAQKPSPPVSPQVSRRSPAQPEPADIGAGQAAEVAPSPDFVDEPPLVEPERSSADNMRDQIREPRKSALPEVDFGDPPQSHFDHEPPFRPRRNPLKVLNWAAGIFAVIAAALIFAVSYWGLPDWVPVERPTFAAGEPDLQLDFPPDQQDRRQLPNGTEYLGASGTITNIGSETRTLPTILIVLRDQRDRIVYSWEVQPDQRTIAPGETVAVTEAVTDIPRSASEVQIGWKPE